MLFFRGSCLSSTFRAFFYWFVPFFVLAIFFSKIKLFVLGLSFDFLVFCYFVFRLKSSLQKNNLSSSKLVLIQFGYTGFSFLGMLLVGGLWCLVSLRWLVWIIVLILSNRVKEKFEMC